MTIEAEPHRRRKFVILPIVLESGDDWEVWEIARFLRREPMILEVVLQHRLTSDSVVTCDLESSHANTFSVHHHWQCWQVDSLLVWTQCGLDTSRGGVGRDMTAHSSELAYCSLRWLTVTRSIIRLTTLSVCQLTVINYLSIICRRSHSYTLGDWT